jgi:hypothetical protein
MDAVSGVRKRRHCEGMIAAATLRGSRTCEHVRRDRLIPLQDSHAAHVLAAITHCGDQIIAAMAGRADAYRGSELTKGANEVRLVLRRPCASGYLSTQS